MVQGDDGLQRHRQLEAAASSVGSSSAANAEEKANGQPVSGKESLLQVEVKQLQLATTSARYEMRRHLHQESLLRQLRDDFDGAYDTLLAHVRVRAGKHPRKDASGELGGPQPKLRQPSEQDMWFDTQLSAKPIDHAQLDFNLRNAARLLHTCRWPLLFDPARSLLEEIHSTSYCGRAVAWPLPSAHKKQIRSINGLEVQDGGDALSLAEEAAVRAYRRQLESVLHYYTQYLRTFVDFQLISVMPGDDLTQDQAAAPVKRRGAVTVDGVSLELRDSPQVFLCKSVAGLSSSVMILQLEFDGIFVCADLYAPLHWPAHRTSSACLSQSLTSGNSSFLPRQRSGGSRQTADWVQSVDDAAIKVLQHLHLQSFLYDFHLHQACLAMLRPSEVEQADFSVLGVLRLLAQHHTATAYGSAPVGAVGALRSQTDGTVSLPHPLAGGEVADFLRFVAQQGSRYSCYELGHPDDEGGFCVVMPTPPSTWCIKEGSEDKVQGEDDGSEDEGWGGDDKAYTQHQLAGRLLSLEGSKLYFCTVLASSTVVRDLNTASTRCQVTSQRGTLTLNSVSLCLRRR
jgi:hypothetical protein